MIKKLTHFLTLCMWFVLGYAIVFIFSLFVMLAGVGHATDAELIILAAIISGVIMLCVYFPNK